MSETKPRAFWFRWAPNEYLGLTLGWPPNARLAYVELLGVQWMKGELPVEPERLRRLVPGIGKTAWDVAWPHLEPEFPVEDGVRRNPNLEAQRDFIEELIDKRRRAGRKGAAARWDGVGERGS